MPKVLVVDDVADNVKLLVYNLSDAGFEVVPAYSGEQALEVAERERPDVILLDIMMPGMDGIETCRRLKADPGLRPIPVILVSARELEGDIIAGLDAGASDYVTKPFSARIVAARVRAAVRVKAAHDTIAEMNRRLDEARRGAEEASRAKSDFLAGLSHEIRTPMNGIMGMTEALLASPLSADQREAAETVRTSAESLLAIVSDILDVSKIEAGRMELDVAAFDLHEVAGGAAALLGESARRRGLGLEVEIAAEVLPRVRGDAGRLRQVLVNLVGNAVKYTDHGDVLLRISGHGLVDGQEVVEFAVIDTGRGIAADDLPRIFQPYSQLGESPSQRSGGTGLGLLISKRLVNLMGGDIGVRSQPGVGSTFWFRVPLAVCAEDQLEPAAPPCAHRRAVVLARGEAQQRIVVGHLAALGIASEVTTSLAGISAFATDAARAGRPFDLALVDAASLGSLDGAAASLPLVVLDGGGEAGPDPVARAGRPVTRAAIPILPGRLRRAVLGALGLGSAEDTVVDGAPSAARGEGLTILVAEDNAVNQRVAVRSLQRLGYATEVVSDGRAAVAAARRGGHAAILMDCHMPGQDGFDATREIRAGETAGLRIPIIALTASVMRGDRERCLAAGMDDYLPKPVRVDDLAALLERWVTAAPRTGAAEVAATAAPAAAVGEPQDTLDPAVLESLRELGSSDLVAELAGLFLADLPRHVSSLESTLAEGDGRALANAAHALKSASLSLGASALVELTARLEVAARAGELALAPQLVAQIQAELARVGDEVVRLAPLAVR